MKKAVFFLLIIFLAVQAYAGIQMETRLSRDEVGMNDTIELEVIVSGTEKNIPPPKAPDMKEFDISGSGRSKNVSIVNGQINATSTYIYVLSPKMMGEFTIPPFTLTYGGKTYRTDPLSIKVVRAKEHDFKFEMDKSSDKQAPDVFIEHQVDSRKAYVGEQIIYSFRVYRRVSFMRNPTFMPPGFSGFLKEELPPNRNYKTTVGKWEYLVTEIKYALFPLNSGSTVIPPAKLFVYIRKDRQTDDLFGSFFSEGKKKGLVTETIQMDILPLPEKGRPAGFSGAVGKFKMKSEIDRPKVKQGEAVTVKTVITGDGDPRPVVKPAMGKLRGFKIYDTVTSEDLQKKNYRVKGSKTFQTVLVPQQAGRLTIPGFSFSYFDPDEGEYKTLESNPFYIDVEKSEKFESGSSPSGGEVSVLNEDIRFISSDIGKKPAPLLLNSFSFRVIAGVPLYLWLVSLVYYLIRRKIIEPRYPLLRRKRMVKRGISQARKLIRKERYQEVYKKIEQMSGYVDNMPPEMEEILRRAKEGVYSPEKNSTGQAGADLKRFIALIRKALKIVIVIIPFIAGTLFSQSLKEGFNNANELFKSEKYQRAETQYQALTQEYGETEGLCYNLGNAYWRMGQPGEARLYWEKSLKINPRDKDARYNIDLLKESIKERETGSFSGMVSETTGRYISFNGMVLAATATVWLLFLSFLIYFWIKKESLIWIGVTALILSALSISTVALRYEEEINKAEGIVIKKTQMYSSPGEDAVSQGTVPEGRKIMILETSHGWVSAGISEQNLKFWVPEDRIGRI